METFEVVVQPASPRLAAMLGDALKAEGIEVQYASGPLSRRAAEL